MSTKQELQKIIDDLKGKKYRETEAKGMMTELQKEQTKALAPVLEEISRQGSARMIEIFEKAIKGIQVNIPDISIPEIEIPEIYIPEFPRIPAPIVNYTPPAIHIPEIKMPNEMNIKGWINLMGYDRGLLLNPLPVQLRDAKGNPIDFGAILQSRTSPGGQVNVSTGGGKTDFFTIKGFMQSAFAELQNPDGRVKVELPTGSSGLTDTELRAAHLDVQQVSGATDSVNVVSSVTLDVKQVSGSIDSVYVTGAAASTFSEIMNPDGRVKVELPTGASGLTDTELRAAHLDVQQTSGAIDSVYVTGFGATVASNLVDSSGVGYSGSNPLPITGPVVVTSITNTTATNIVDSTGVPFEGANPFPVVLASNSSNTVGAAIVDSSGVEYSGSNPIPITMVSGGITSTTTVGDSAARSADNGGNPVKVGGIARQTNPTAFADGDRSNITTDDLGRQLVRPVQVRDLMVTAYATFTTGTEATLLSGVAATYLDLVYILASNNSTAAIGIDIRPSTAGSIVMHLEIPANGTVGVAAPVPIPQQATGDGTGGSWTVDLPDVTGTTVSVSGLFSKEI